MYYILLSPIERLKTINPGAGHLPSSSSPPRGIYQRNANARGLARGGGGGGGWALLELTDALLSCNTGQKYGWKAEQENWQTKQPKLSVKKSGIINPLFDGLTYKFNMCGYQPSQNVPAAGDFAAYNEISASYYTLKLTK